MIGNQDKIEFILQHGWGLSSSCWNLWKKILEKKYRVKIPDRGYFGEKSREESFCTKNKKILVSHSFGLYLFTEKILKEADYLIIISGFSKFHPEEKREKRRSLMLMKFMKKKLLKEPEKLLLDFYNGHPLRGAHDIYPHVKILSKDLDAIDSEDLDLEYLKKIKNILIIQGKKDMVVPWSRAVFLKKALPGSHLIFFEKEDHALPFTRTEEVINLILDYVHNGELPKNRLVGISQK